MNHPAPAPFDVRLMNAVASALLVTCGLLVLAASARWLLQNDVFAIQKVVVRGELSHYSPATLRTNVAHKLEGNFFTMNLVAVRRAFEGVPWIRSAAVQREFPNRLNVVLREHEAVAYWGPESGAGLINTQGEVFEANVAEVELQDSMPRLMGPAGSSAEVLAMHRLLRPIFALLDMRIEQLRLASRGGWHVEMNAGAEIALGDGTPAEVAARSERFVRTLTQVTSQYARRAQTLESADLRHADGYAIRLRGVTTTVDMPAAKK